MEWYTLDDSLRRDSVIQGFQSFIWTERYSKSGDFQIVTDSSYSNRSMFIPKTMIAMDQSNYVMICETVTDALADDGSRKLTVTGRSFESLLDERIAMPALGDLASTPKWVVSGTPATIARYIFNQVCVAGVISPNDAIPFYQPGTFLPAGNIPEPPTAYIMEFDPDTVYNNLVKICDIWPIGFRLVRNGDSGGIFFDVYTGSDLTSSQTVFPPVIFSPDMETISKTSHLRSTAGTKTVAYVFGKNGSRIVYADGFDSSVSGIHRKVLFVNADSIDLPPGTELNAALDQKGLEELSKHVELYSVDGEIPQYLPYRYGSDYRLGDKVEERDPEGFVNQMLVTEHIFVSDHEGERSYPTLTAAQVITAGSWEALSTTEHWDDAPVAEHWDDA